MSKLIVILSVLFVLAADADKVYICDSRYSKCYHRTDKCEGLDLCNSEVRAITLSEARKQGRRPCNYCYPKKK